MAVFHARPRRTVHGRGVVETIQLDEILFVPTMVMIVPWQASTVLAVGTIVGSIAARRPLIKAAFNLGQLSFAGACGMIFVYLAGVTPTSQPSMYDTVVAMLASLLLTFITGVLVRAIMAYMNAIAFWPLMKDLRNRIGPWAGAVTVGGIATIAIGRTPWSGILVVGVIVFIHRAYAASVDRAERPPALRGRPAGDRVAANPYRPRASPARPPRDTQGAARRRRASPSSPTTSPIRRAPTARRSATANGCGSTTAAAPTSGTTATATPCSRWPASPATCCARPS